MLLRIYYEIYLCNPMSVIARLTEVFKTYQVGDQLITALQPTTMEVRDGELLLIVGPSGSGKTTLLSLLGCVIYPTGGILEVNGKLISDLNERQLARLRLESLGFVFQTFNLIAPLTAEQNIAAPLELLGLPGAEIRKRVKHALDIVNMTDRRKNLPKQLSGGQQQRIAIARALVTEPRLILCDEPTAALDNTSMGTIMEELRHLADQGKGVAVVTHDLRLMKYAHRAVSVENGAVREISAAELERHFTLH